MAISIAMLNHQKILVLDRLCWVVALVNGPHDFEGENMNSSLRIDFRAYSIVIVQTNPCGVKLVKIWCFF